jgi:fluoride exporter
MNIYKILIVAMGGSLGSVARYIGVKTIDSHFNAQFPAGTFSVNILGSFIIGVVYAIVARKTGGSESWLLFLGTGFCGGFTTFSAFAFENVSLINQRLPMTSVIYIISSVALGLLAVIAGMALGKNV